LVLIEVLVDVGIDVDIKIIVFNVRHSVTFPVVDNSRPW
jgi:hypothetical protein